MEKLFFICIFALKLKNNKIMIKEEIGLGIVCTLALLFIFYGIGKFIITCIRDEKFIKKADLVYKNAENEYNKFIEFLKTQVLLKDSKSL